jgi:hypothetical protein
MGNIRFLWDFMGFDHGNLEKIGILWDLTMEKWKWDAMEFT